ncbi:MAG: phosphoglucomutase/phosphomannomutase family protein [Candidatus Omnitrophota bacterium]
MSETNSNIRFGTDGWRAVIADNFTFDNVRIVAQAIAGYVKGKRLKDKGLSKTLIVGYDRRFLSKEYAKIVSEVLAGNGIKVLLTKNPTPTPVISFAIKKQCLDGGIIITASHNPPKFNGIKFKTNEAAPADEKVTGDLEKRLGKSKVKVLEIDVAIEKKLIQFVNVDNDYIDFIKNYVNIDLIKKAPLRILVDYMHGAGIGYIEKFLGDSKSRLDAIRDFDDPLFGGINPEPIPKNLKFPAALAKRRRWDLIVALDGDADRIGALRPDGVFISSGQVISLLLLHLLNNKGKTGTVVKTISGTTLIEHICDKFHLGLIETPVGFKHISALIQKQKVLIGGEESGGIGFCDYIPERDGILSALLLIEMLAVTGMDISSIIKKMDADYGVFRYDRIDVEYPKHKADALAKFLVKKPLKVLSGRKVLKVKTYDGIKFITEDESWLLLRFSGTEPLIRLYAEAHTNRDVKKLLEEGKNLIR